MAKYSKTHKPSIQTVDTANSIAQGIKKPAQTKEQTKLISQGIQKGIEQFKKQQKTKSKEQEKKHKKRKRDLVDQQQSTEDVETTSQLHWLPWLLLGLTWAGIAWYVLAGSWLG